MAKVLARNRVNPADINNTGVKFTSQDASVYIQGAPINLGLGDYSLRIYAMSEGGDTGKGIYVSAGGYLKNTLEVFPVAAQVNGISAINFQGTLTGANALNSLTINYPTRPGLHHILITRKGTTVTAYINGKTKPEWTKEQDRVLEFDALVPKIQCSQHFAQMRIFNACLSATEAKMLYNGGRPDKYRLNGDLWEKCLHEYLPSGICSKSWKDSKGTNNLIPTGVPEIIKTPTVIERIAGEGAPTALPLCIGQEYYDSTNRNAYISKGIEAAGDWVLI